MRAQNRGSSDWAKKDLKPPFVASPLKDGCIVEHAQAAGRGPTYCNTLCCVMKEGQPRYMSTHKACTFVSKPTERRYSAPAKRRKYTAPRCASTASERSVNSRADQGDAGPVQLSPPKSSGNTSRKKVSSCGNLKICSANQEKTSNEKFEAQTLERLSGLSVVNPSGNWRERSGT